MNLPEGERKRRIEFAYALEVVFVYLFTYIRSLKKLDEELDKDELEEMLYRHLYDAIEDYGLDVERYDLEPYIEHLAEETIDSTLDDDDDEEEEEYKTSKERAKLITQHEVNNVYATICFEDAKRMGLKHKQWIWHQGEKGLTRLSHEMVDARPIPLEQDFIVGGDRIPYPHAYKVSPKHTINCMCRCEYLK